MRYKQGSSELPIIKLNISHLMMGLVLCTKINPRWQYSGDLIKIREKMINNKKIKQQGFSLVELMIVLAIISTLTIIVLVAGGKMFSILNHFRSNVVCITTRC
jgi:prepilin-type N-terminal cleavage/methylation domain-containing protein